MMKRLPLFFLLFIAILALPTVAAEDVLDSLTRQQSFEARRVSSSHEDLGRNGDARSIDAGETLVLGDLEGPGIISHIWTTVGSEDPFYPRNLVLRFYWDGADKPSIEAPLGDFFGVGHGASQDFTSMPVATSSLGRSRNCFWKMPFRKSAKITVTNESKEHETDSFYYYLDWQKHDQLPEDTTYFHAQYRQAMPAVPGDYTILETEGRGHYVGTVYSAHQVELGWFGEGDDRFYIDGEDFPSMRGTGTEDYFGDAWGFRQFATPYYGVSLWEGYFPGDRVTAYRWHIQDPVPFKKSLKLSIEHHGSVFTDEGVNLGQFTERPDSVSSVAFWYQYPPVAFTEPIPPAEERLAPYKILPASSLVCRAEPAQLLATDPPSVNYMPMAEDSMIEFDFEIADAGKYQINAYLFHSVFSAVNQPLLDGKPLGDALDFCFSGHDPVWISFDLHDLEAGKHTLRFESKGLSPNRRTDAPPMQLFGMTHLILLRLEDMPGYHEARDKKLLEKAAKE